MAAWRDIGVPAWRPACSARRFRGALVIVNIVGSFVIGFFATLTGPDGRLYASSIVRQFVMFGICGGYTTFSSFSLQTLNLVNDGEWLRAGGNVVVSVVLLHGIGVDRPCAGIGTWRLEVDLTMQIPRDAVLLRIFFGEDDKSASCPCTRPSC